MGFLDSVLRECRQLVVFCLKPKEISRSSDGHYAGYKQEGCSSKDEYKEVLAVLQYESVKAEKYDEEPLQGHQTGKEKSRRKGKRGGGVAAAVNARVCLSAERR